MSMHTRYLYSAWGILVLVCILGFSYTFFTRTQLSVEQAARAATQECTAIPGDHSACYEQIVPDLYSRFSVPQLFQVVRLIRSLDPSYQYCHVLAHKIGNRAVAADPNAWLSVIPLNPADGLCSNGFIHGVFEGRFGADVLDDATIERFLPQFKQACEPRENWHPSPLDQAVCYHGMGHLADFITDAHLPKALDFCARITPNDYRRVCVQGVFMQIYQPLEPDDYALIERMPVKPTATTVRSFCAVFSDPMAHGSCLEESWPLFRDTILDGSGVKDFCSGQPNSEEEDQCYIAMSSIIGRTSLGSVERAVAACGQFPKTRQLTCYEFSAQAVLEEDLNDGGKAVQVCNRAGGVFSQACIDSLVSRAAFTFGSNTQAFEGFCDDLSGTSRGACRQILQSQVK